MKTFYVTFGIGTLLRGYHAVVNAQDEAIVHAWMKRRAGIPYCAVYDRVPKGSKPLQADPEVLCYANASHI